MSAAVGVAILALASGSCRPGNDEQAIIATVGDREIVRGDYQRHLELITGQTWPSVPDVVASRVLDDYLELEAAVGEAAYGLPVDPKERSRSLRELVEQRCSEAPHEPAMVAQKMRLAGNDLQPRLRLRQLLLDDLESASKARERILAGESFDEVSAEVSRAPNADAGGGLGFVDLEALPEIFAAAVAELDEGEVSPPVEGPVGVHVFQVLERETSESRLEAEQARRRQQFERDRASRHLDECIATIAAAAQIDVDSGRLWFRYDGRHATHEPPSHDSSAER